MGGAGRGRVVSAPTGVGRGGKVAAGSALAEKKKREVSVGFSSDRSIGLVDL